VSRNGFDQAAAPPRGRRGSTGSAVLHSAAVLRRIVARYRTRADRRHRRFSLLVFHVAEARHSGTVEAAVLEQFGRTSRAVRAGSWLSPGELAVMLADTGAAGADRFALRVTRWLGADAAAVPWSRHTYPDRCRGRKPRTWSDEGGRQAPATASRLDRPPQSSALVGPAAAAAANGPAYMVNGHGLQNDCSAIHSLLVKPQPWWKRAVDLIASALGLVLLAPLLALVALWIKLSSPGPVIFRQQRIGAGGRPFTLWKFRTIEVSDAPPRHSQYVADLMQSGRPAKKLDHELPVIPFGRVLRRFGIDELPQLVNVLCGQMSLVGPRPDVIPYGSYPLWQRRRFDVLPGITGLWQVSGKNHTTFNTMIQLDNQYADRRSLWLDLAILLRTVPAVLRG
jgi:lipopolysaccharide/colanic/teichoic acid biosynthesis glycosyltransferase